MKPMHQSQPTPVSCTQTCLAMMLHIPVEEVLKVFPLPMGQFDLLRAMESCGVRYQAIAVGHLMEGLYTACVPSLNHPGMLHQVIFDVDFDHDDGHALHVYDPNDGRDGVNVYHRDGSNMKSWADLVRFEIGGKLPREGKLAALSARNTDVESWLADAEHRVCELAGALRTIEKLANGEGEGEPLVRLLAIRERARTAALAQETPTLAIAKSDANTTPGWNHTGTGMKLTVEEAQAPETPTLVLNKEDSAAFIDALMNPRPPSERLKRAMARRKELVQDKETQP